MEFLSPRVIGRIKLDNTAKHLVGGLAQAGLGFKSSAFSIIAHGSRAPSRLPSFPPPKGMTSGVSSLTNTTGCLLPVKSFRDSYKLVTNGCRKISSTTTPALNFLSRDPFQPCAFISQTSRYQMIFARKTPKGRGDFSHFDSTTYLLLPVHF